MTKAGVKQKCYYTIVKEYHKTARGDPGGLFIWWRMGESFYKSKRWKRLRAKVLARDGYQCQESKRYGKVVPANTVHHVFPLTEYPEYRWESWNLVSLCHDMHNQMHDRNTNALTDKGLDLMRRVARKQGISLESTDAQE